MSTSASKRRVFCTAGMSHFLLYPNGDVYRCMDEYNSKGKPLFNILDKEWAFNNEAVLCDAERCYAACDIDWAQKFIVDDNGEQSIIKAQIEHSDPMNGAIWTAQTMGPRTIRFAHIIWAPTLACNYTCAYCGCAMGEKKLRHDFSSSFPELSIEQWLSAWERLLNYLDYAVINISGGEPLLSPVTVPVIEQISRKFAIGLTTNMSKNIMELSRGMILAGGNLETKALGDVRIGLQRITASLHPSSQKFNEPLFKGSVLLLKNNLNCAVVVNFVGYPLQLYLADEWKTWADAHGIRFVLSPWCGTDNVGNHASYTPNELEYVDSLAPKGRQTTNQLVFNRTAHEIVVSPGVSSVLRGQIIRITGTITNKGDLPWEKGKGENILKIGGRLRIRHTSQLVSEHRAEFTADQLDPGAVLDFFLSIDTAPLQEGKYSLYLDIVREGAFWMQDKGAEPMQIDIDVL